MLLFADNPNYYSYANSSRKWTAIYTHGSYVTYSITNEGRSNRPCWKRLSNNSSGSGYLGFSPFMTRTGIWVPATGGVFGSAYKIQSLAQCGWGGAYPYNGAIFQIKYGSVDGGISVQVNTDGTLDIWRTDSQISQTKLGTTPQVFSNGVWSYVEFVWEYADSGGIFEVWKDGVTQVFDFEGDTKGGSVGTWTSVRTCGQAMTMNYSMWSQDCYLLDNVQVDAKDRITRYGDIEVASDYPDEDGYYEESTPNSSPPGDHYDRVNNDDDDTTFNTLDASGQRDSFSFPNLTSDPLGVIYVSLPRKESDGAASLACLERYSGNDTESMLQGVVGTSYDKYLLQPKDFHEPSDSEWSLGLANATEAGYKKG